MTNRPTGSPGQQPGAAGLPTAQPRVAQPAGVQPPSNGRRSPAGLIDQAMARRYVAELIGTGLLVFFGAGAATVNFGFSAFGSSVAAGILLTGLVFGLVLLGLVAVIGPISSCHVNPAVSLGAFLTKRIRLVDLIGYWIAQLAGGLLGALLLLWVMHSSPLYSLSKIGLGANGYGRLSLLHASGGGAFLIEVVLTAVFVLVVLAATRKQASAPVAGVVVGLTLALVNIAGIPIDGASVNPARSFGPAVIVGGQALSQLWLFLVAPLVGAVFGVAVYLLFHRRGDDVVRASDTRLPGGLEATASPAAGADEAGGTAAGHAQPGPDGPAESADPPDDTR
ncbi:MAG: aquaporin [Streptosporangiaceae bacterium]